MANVLSNKIIKNLNELRFSVKNGKIAPSCDSYLNPKCTIFSSYYYMLSILCIPFYAYYYKHSIICILFYLLYLMKNT